MIWNIIQIIAVYQWRQDVRDWHISRLRRTVRRCWLAGSGRSLVFWAPCSVEQRPWRRDQSDANSHSVRLDPRSNTPSACRGSEYASGTWHTNPFSRSLNVCSLYSFLRKSVSKLRSVTCHIASHSVTCHRWKQTTPASQADGRVS